MTYKFIAFRASPGFVTDDAADTHSLGEPAPQTRNGVTFDWDGDYAASSRDRDAGQPAKLAGVIFAPNGGPVRTFVVALPDGAGTYNVRLALGDAGSIQTNQKVVIKDGGTIRATLTAASTEVGQFVDATGVDRGFTWTSDNQPAQWQFSTGNLTIELGNTGSGTSTIAALGWELAGGAQALAGAAAAVAAASGSLSVTGAVGTLTTLPLKNNAGTVLASEAGATAHVYSLAGGLVVTKAAQTSSASGVMTITDAAIVPTTQYRVVIVLASGAEGLAKLTAT